MQDVLVRLMPERILSALAAGFPHPSHLFNTSNQATEQVKILGTTHHPHLEHDALAIEFSKFIRTLINSASDAGNHDSVQC